MKFFQRIVKSFLKLSLTKKIIISVITVSVLVISISTIVVQEQNTRLGVGKHCFVDFDCQSATNGCVTLVCKNEKCSNPVNKPDGTACTDNSWNIGSCKAGKCSSACEYSDPGNDGYPEVCTGANGPISDTCDTSTSIKYAFCNPSLGCYSGNSVSCPPGKGCWINPEGRPKCSLKAEIPTMTPTPAPNFSPDTSITNSYSPTLTPTSTVTPTPTLGFRKKTVNLPSGSQTYAIQGGHHSPNFTEATVDPVSVAVGSTQTMTVKINDTYAITSVEARVETDGGTNTYTLNLISGTNLDGTWQSSWVVHDTHNTTYRTTFYAIDSNNESGSVVLSWSDPCTVPSGGDWNLTGNCTVAGTNGADNGNIDLTNGGTQDWSITMASAGAILAFNSGKSIILKSGGHSGTIVKVAGSQVKKTNLWMIDADSDNYPKTFLQLAQDTAPSNGRRRNLLSFTNYTDGTGFGIDYDDTNASVYPGTICSGNCTINTDTGTCTNAPPASYPTGSSCSAIDCHTGATKYYWGYNVATCYYRADLSAGCNGSGGCLDITNCAGSGMGVSTGVTATTCRAHNGCTGTTGPTVTPTIAAGSDPYDDCTGLDCSGGATKYYWGYGTKTSSNATCYYRANVSSSDHVCNGGGVCKTAAQQCPSSGQGAAAATVSRATCKDYTGCSGTTAGSSANLSCGFDTWSDCGGSDNCGAYTCDGGGNCGNSCCGGFGICSYDSKYKTWGCT